MTQPELDVVIAMPAFNEGLRITSFVSELVTAFDDLRFHLVVVDDCSTDGTQVVLEKLASVHSVDVIRNERNSGHGPSTLRALDRAISLNPSYILSTDGDGHVAGFSLRRLFDQLKMEPSLTVIEGVRTQRNDPWFRKFVSAITRKIVGVLSGRAPLDANTPFRVYRSDDLIKLRALIPNNHLTPNLLISKLVRSAGLQIAEIEIPLKPRGSEQPAGSTWKQKYKAFPSRKFLVFCLQASRQWLKS